MGSSISSSASTTLLSPLTTQEPPSYLTPTKSPSPVMSKELSTTSASRYTSPSLDNIAENQATRLLDLGITPISPTKPQQQTQEQDQEQGPKPNEARSATAKASSGSKTKAKEAIIPYERVRKLELELRKVLHHWRFSSRMFRGYVYILTSASRPNLVKIGIATDPDRRVKQLRRDCKLPHMKIVHLTRELQWPARLEKLVHCQLAMFTRTIKCEHGGRLRYHKEWFGCSLETAMRVVDAWARWLRGEPYTCGVLKESWTWKADLLVSRWSEDDESFEEMFARHVQWMEQATD